MAVDRSQFHIEIKSTADLAAMDATIAKLQGQIAATEALGKSTEALENELHKAQQTKIEASLAGITGKTKETGKASEEAATGVEKLGLTHRQLGATLREVAPGLSEMVHFLTTGVAGAIGLALIAFSYLKDKIEDFSKMLDALDTGPGARGEWAEKISDNVRDAAVEQAEFNERLRETAERQETLAQTTDQLIEVQKRQAADAKALGDAQKELDLARLSLAEKLGQINPDQAVRIRLDIDDAAFQRQLAAEKAAIQAELGARQQEFDANNAREPQLNSAVDRTAAAALAAKNAQDKNQAELDQDKANNDKDKALLKEAEAKVKELKETETFGLTINPIEYAQRKSAENTVESLSATIENRESSMRSEKARQTPLAEAAALAKMQAEAAKSDYAEAAKLSDDVLKTVNKLKADLAAATAKNAALQNIHDQSNAVAAATARAPQTLAAQQVLLNRAASPDRGEAATALEASQFTTLSTAASDAMRNADINLRHGGVGAAGPSSVPQLIGLVQQLTQFLAAHPALQPQARGDMQSEIDEIKRDLADLSSRNAMNRGFQP